MKPIYWFILKQTIIMLIILIITTLLAYALNEMSFRKENILLVYIIAVMITIIESKKFTFGFITAILCVLIFNFLFTEPQYTFIINDPNYIVSMIIFIIVSFIIGSLAVRLQSQVRLSLKNQKKIEQLYSMSRKLLHLHSIKDIALFEIDSIQNYINHKVHIQIIYDKETYNYYKDDFFPISHHKKEINWCMQSSIICGKSENHFSNIDYTIFPLKIDKTNIGVLVVDCQTEIISSEHKEFINLTIAHMMLAIERELIAIKEENTRIEIKNERFKLSLLRSISHDLRTPLTSISAGTSLLLEKETKLDDITKKNIIMDMDNEVNYLTHFVDNILSLTKIDAGKLVVTKKKEVIDDILVSVSQRFINRLGSHTFHFDSSEEVVFTYVDAQLIIQVFVNLIDNVIKHGKKDATVRVSYKKENCNTIFYVIDDGGGIPSNIIDNIFKPFSTQNIEKSDKHRGVGLGLNICKNIVESHGGTIEVANNDIGGATFTIIIPD